MALALLCLWLGMFVIVNIRESQSSVCRPVRGKISVHIFREQSPTQRRVRLSPIESFVLNAATATDEQQRPLKIKSCFHKTPDSHRDQYADQCAERDRSHFQSLPPRNGACD